MRNLQPIADALIALGFDATVEYPGCICIDAHRIHRPDCSWWFGTANGPWQGDLMDATGDYAGETLGVGVDGDEVDVQVIARGIGRAVLGAN